jgi:hypothetical protein
VRKERKQGLTNFWKTCGFPGCCFHAAVKKRTEEMREAGKNVRGRYSLVSVDENGLIFY